MTNSITNRQLFFIILLALTTYTTIDLPKYMTQSAGRSSWIPIIITSFISGLAILIIAKLNNMFQGKVFFDYSIIIVGKFFSYVIAVYYTLYFFVIGIYLKLKLVGLLTSNFLPNTPQVFMLIFGIMTFGYVAYKGITNIARMFEIYGTLFLIITIMLCILMMIEGMKENILPFFNANDAKNYLDTMKNLIVPFGGVEILFIIPFTIKNKQAPRFAFFTLLFIGLFYVLIVESTIMILGVNNTLTLNDSFVEAMKIIEIPVIERADIFYLTFGLANLFAGMIIVFAGVVEFACRLFPKVQRYAIVISIIIVFFILSTLALDIKNLEKVFSSFANYLVLVSGVLIPVILFITAKARKLGVKNKD